MRTTISAIALLALFPLLLFASRGAVAAPAWQICHLPGQRAALRCATIDVPRDYADPGKGTLALHVTVAPSIRAKSETDPLFVLAGGPGQAGSDIVFLLDKALAKVHASRDIVFIDQRGTGRSERLDCDDGIDPLTRSDGEQKAATLACLRGFGERLLTYTTQAAAEDLEQVRSALGAARINLWGGSYGSRLAQAYARLHPDQVRSLILDGVVDDDLIIGADNDAFQATLDATLQRCAADANCARAFPALPQTLHSVLHKLDAAVATVNLPHPRTGQPVTLPISHQRVLQTIRYLLYSPHNAARLPYAIARADAGDWRPMISLQASSADVAVAQPAAGLLVTIACREDWPRLDAQRREAQTRSGTFGNANLAELDDLCGALALPAAPRPPAQTLSQPSLLLSGALDPVTPPSRAESAARGLSQAQHVIVANAGHIISATGCAPALLRRFLDAPLQSLDAACLADTPLPAFQIDAAGTAP